MATTVDAVARTICVALSCEHASVYLPDEHGGLALAWSHPDDDVATSFDVELFAEEVQDHGGPLLLAGTDPDTSGGDEQHADVSVYGVPLRVGTRSVGVVVLTYTGDERRGFMRLPPHVAAAVADQAAIAIDNAQRVVAEHTTVLRLEELDQAKSDYLAGITHDLRTPLTAVLGFVSTLRRIGPHLSGDAIRTYLEVVERQALRLSALVDDLLLAARLESGPLVPVQLDRVDLTTAVEEALETIEPQRRARVDVAGMAPAVVHGDRSQLVRVVQNLLDNALKYSPPGSRVVASVAIAGTDAHIDVANDGAAIPPEERERIFERFRTGRAGARTGSSGLGLYIVRGIVRGHGGEVSVVDTAVDGVVFRVSLPLAAA